MAHVKCALVGIVTGVGAAVIWVTLRAFMVLLSVATGESGGLSSGELFGVAAVPYAGIVGFALGFYLMWRRQRARTARR